jgi:diguanylate cyclase (GGDEF)-like protein/PAS domain S-box-containing protein
MLEQVRVLRRRVALTLAGLVLVTAGGAAGALLLNERLDVRHQEVAYAAAERMATADRAVAAQQERSASARGYLLTGDPVFLERRKVARDAFLRELDYLATLGRNEPDLAPLHALAARLSQASDLAMHKWREDRDQAIALWDREARPVQEQLTNEMHALASAERASYEAARSAATNSVRQSRRLTLALGGVVIGALAVMFLQFARTVRDTLNRVRGVQERTMFRLLDQVPVGIFVLDADGDPYYTNRKAEQYLGSPAHYRARHLTEAYHAFEAGTNIAYPMARTPIARALRGEASEVSDMEIRRGDSVIPLLVHGCPVYDDEGKLTHAVAAFQDVRELTQKALVDALTGLANRGALMQLFTRERLLCERVEKRLGVAIVDIDHFKSINDTHGHAVGDKVLQRVACTIVEALRRTDIVARWGGEEFVLLLPGCEAEGLHTPVEKALCAVRNQRFSAGNTAGFSVTFSAGAVLLERGETLESCVARADALLYRAKGAGRNRVLVDAEPTNPYAKARQRGGAAATHGGAAST